MIALADLRTLAAERAALTNPVDRIALDNRWVDGVPLGLRLMALALDDKEATEKKGDAP